MRPTTLAVIGLEPLGGSLAWQARRAGIPRVIGYSPQPADAVRALKVDAISDMALTPEKAVHGADLIVIAASPTRTAQLIGALAPQASPDAILTDVASVKAPVCRAAAQHGLADRFAGSHPLPASTSATAGRTGPDLLRGAVVYVCPVGSSQGDQAVRQVMHFWSRVMEAEPVLIEAERHDRQVAWTRHLPQAVSCLLAKTLAARRLGGVSFGPGARDATRLAAEDPEDWADLLLENAGPILEALAKTERELTRLQTLLERGDRDGLRSYLADAAAFRRGIER
ncbi:MAG: prephenate dehydrogenase [Gemmatimonadales bacterium]|nr:prephenate dehydrogenase [Gemmatimonadales bacterium]